MNTFPLRIAGAGLLFVFIFFFGFWLSRTGKPYPGLLFTIHKLIALGTLVFLAATLYQIHQATPLAPSQITVGLVTAVCFIITILTGGLLNIERTLPPVVFRLHQIMPYVTALSTFSLLYLLLARSRELLMA